MCRGGVPELCPSDGEADEVTSCWSDSEDGSGHFLLALRLFVAGSYTTGSSTSLSTCMKDLDRTQMSGIETCIGACVKLVMTVSEAAEASYDLTGKLLLC